MTVIVVPLFVLRKMSVTECLVMPKRFSSYLLSIVIFVLLSNCLINVSLVTWASHPLKSLAFTSRSKILRRIVYLVSFILIMSM